MEQGNQANPYAPPRVIDSKEGSPLRETLRPTIAEMVFFASLAVASLVIHWNHRAIFDELGIVTVELMFGSSFFLALIGCGITSVRNGRDRRPARVIAHIVGVVVALIATFVIVWMLMTNGLPPNGLIVFASVVAGIVATRVAMR